MAQRVEDARGKVSRANENLRDLRSGIGAFLNANPPPIEFVRDDHCESGQVICTITSVSDPPTRLGVMLGELMHNLRSALDVLNLYVLHGDGAPETSRKENFRWFSSADEFGRTVEALKKRPMACGVNVLEKTKPYDGGDDTLKLLLLANDRDKHFAPSAVVVGVGAATIRRQVYGVSEYSTHVDRMSPIPIEKGTKLVFP